jgi:hypothetical protein
MTYDVCLICSLYTTKAHKNGVLYIKTYFVAETYLFNYISMLYRKQKSGKV